MYKVKVIENEKISILDVDHNEDLYTILSRHGFSISATCGGNGTCGKCKVIIDNPKEPNNHEKKLLSSDELKNNIRLACLYNVDSNIEVKIINSQNKAKIMKNIYNNKINLNKSIKIKEIELGDITLNDQRSLSQRIIDNIGTNINISLQTLEKLLHNKLNNFYVVYNEKELIDIRQVNNLFSIAIDIGTTTVVIYLLDLLKGEIVDAQAFLNPQRIYGADVITRIDFCNQNENGVNILSKTLIQKINSELEILFKRNKLSSEDIYKAVIVGNTTMLHILLNINPHRIAVAPFVPIFTNRIVVKANQINLNINNNSEVIICDSVSGYIGADILSGIIATEIYKQEKFSLLLDLGTNGEMVLGNQDIILCCSTATGPAFEGATLKCGMNALDGAVDSIRILNNEIEVSTIGNKKAIGICGSGIIAIIAELLENGYIDFTGKFDENAIDKNNKFFSEIDNKIVFKITDDVYVTQQDIREIQLAKSAVSAGILTLLENANITFDDIENVYLAGGFGNFINPSHAVKIGLIPEPLKDKVKPVGNTAGNGAILASFDDDKLALFNDLKNNIKYIELSNSQRFNDLFIENMLFA
ncbi:ASKHA domain-containing protein [Caldicellulosiruptoraceae bacterium PP1]